MTWPRQRLKYLTRVIDRRAGSYEPPLLTVSIHHGVVPRKSITDDLPRAEDLSNYKLCAPGDIVLNRMRAFQGAVGVASTEGIVSPDYLILRPTDGMDSRYLHHLFRSKWLIGEMSSRLRGIGGTENGAVRTPRVNPEDLRDICIPRPTLAEQRRIAGFLDAETVQIETIQACRARQKHLLSLRRERLVEEILGLDADVGVKDFTPIRHIVRQISVGIVITPAMWYVDQGGVPALRGLNVRPGRIDYSSLIHISHEGNSVYRKSQLHAGDLVVVRTGQAGATAVIPTELDGANCIDLVIIRPGPDLLPHYLEYLLNSDYARRRIEEYAVGSIQAHFNVGAMKEMPIPRIPLDRQALAVEELDRKTGWIDDLMAHLETQQQLLNERRRALITAAVTGQIDVSTASGRGVS